MGFFSTALDVKVEPDGRTFTLLATLEWQSARTGERIVVPAGFQTDFASVPRLFWNIFPPIGRYAKAAVIHDWLYRTGLVPRAGADAYLLEAMIDCGSPWYERYPIYHQVRLWGWLSYKGR